MFALPKSLGAIAKICDRRESSRFALQCVQLEADKSGEVVVTATDSKVLLRATVHTDNSDAVSPCLIDGEDWSLIFSLAKVRADHVVDDEGDVEERKTEERVTVESVTGELCTFGIGGDKTIAVKPSLSKYPNVNDILKASRKGDAVYSIRVDPVLLARQLLALAEVCEEDTPCGIKLEFRDSTSPIVCEMKGDKVAVVALLMPLRD